MKWPRDLFFWVGQVIRSGSLLEMLKMVRLEPKTGQPHVFANFFGDFFWQNHYLGLSEVAHGPSGAFRWAIWASSMWACGIWASPMWACATWASSRASGLDNCCCLLLCALPWLGWLARLAAGGGCAAAAVVAEERLARQGTASKPAKPRQST